MIVDDLVLNVTSESPASRSFVSNISNNLDVHTFAGSSSWNHVVNSDSTEVILQSNCTDYSYNLNVSLIEITSTLGYGEFYNAQSSLVNGISNSIVMSGTMGVIIIAIGIVFIVSRFVF
jgi:hypothetical protein